ncbi:MAG TPA: hypothetical protein VGC09_15635 [Rhodopila sp.]
MPAPTIDHYRAPRARVAVAYRTKDRTELTRLTAAPLIDDRNIDLYWFDGSTTASGQQLPAELCAGRAAICQLHLGVVGGPDCAIMYALETLRAQAYDYLILVENDVLLSGDWLRAMHAAVAQAKAAGFNVGGATVRVFDRRVLSFNDTYCLMLNAGAGFIALTPPAVDIVMANYRTLDGEELLQQIRQRTGKDFSATVEFEPSWRLSADFTYDLMLYLHGYVVVAPPVTHARMIDGTVLSRVRLVTSAGQHLPELRSLITEPGQITNDPPCFSRFQASPLSSRLLIGCHQLLVAVNAPDAREPVRLEGSWHRTWLQGLGPFGLTGAGRISVSILGSTVGLLLHAGVTGAELHLLGSDGTRLSTTRLEPDIVMDLPFTAEGLHSQEIVLRVASGQVCLIGLTASAAVADGYANDRPGVSHLPI